MDWWNRLVSALPFVVLGLDNLLMAVALGVSKAKRKLAICFVFALFEGLMPAAGMAIGAAAGSRFGIIGTVVGLLVMAGLGIYMLFEDEDEADRIGHISGWGIVAAAVALSLDELAAGFSFGLLAYPIWISAAVLFGQALVFGGIGLAFGRRLKPLLGEWAEKAGGAALLATAVFLAWEQWMR